MRKIYILIGLCCLILGCKDVRYPINENKTEINIYIDKEFNKEEVVEIRRGIEEWNYAMSGAVVLSVVSEEFNMEVSTIKEGGWFILKTDSIRKSREDSVGHYVLGYVNKIGGSYLSIVSDRVRYNLKMIVMHEIGHLLGIRHTDSGLMLSEFVWDEFKCIDKVTMKEFGKIYRINLDRLRYC
tara:strand:+ start:199 stop:747 length:549 start_codon:yes stop_codon:yes gene_type:complete